jgi:hypothetical protein
MSRCSPQPNPPAGHPKAIRNNQKAEAQLSPEPCWTATKLTSTVNGKAELALAKLETCQLSKEQQAQISASKASRQTQV